MLGGSAALVIFVGAFASKAQFSAGLDLPTNCSGDRIPVVQPRGQQPLLLLQTWQNTEKVSLDEELPPPDDAQLGELEASLDEGSGTPENAQDDVEASLPHIAPSGLAHQSGLEASPLSQHLPRHVAEPRLGQVRVSVVHDGGSAVVHFVEPTGSQLHYRLQATSIYSPNAKIVAHTEDGKVQKLEPRQRAFGSRQAGQVASAVLHENGSVSGLFEHGGEFLQIHPSDSNTSGNNDDPVLPDGRSMLQISAGQGLWHHAHPMSLSELSKFRTSVVLSRSNGSLQEPSIAVDDVGNHSGKLESNLEPSMELPGGQWTGTKWWPGCYSGDSSITYFKIGIIADVRAWQRFGSQLQGMLEGIVLQASIIYEAQFHINLQIDSLQIYQSDQNAPSVYSSSNCQGTINRQLEGLRADSSKPAEAATHLFTGCGVGYGVVGLAYVGAICGGANGYQVGVNQLQDYSGRGVVHDTWLTFAHELGHNFNGQHSFEEGSGTTGGIMDYGNGQLDGEFQFNTQYRYSDMCTKMNGAVNKCYGKFGSSSTGSPSTPGGTRRRQPAPARRTALLGCACKESWNFYGIWNCPQGYCCDNWCMVEDPWCQWAEWGYCA